MLVSYDKNLANQLLKSADRSLGDDVMLVFFYENEVYDSSTVINYLYT